MLSKHGTRKHCNDKVFKAIRPLKPNTYTEKEKTEGKMYASLETETEGDNPKATFIRACRISLKEEKEPKGKNAFRPNSEFERIPSGQDSLWF